MCYLAGGLRYDSIAQMPERIRQQVAGKLVAAQTVVVSPKTQGVAAGTQKTPKFKNKKTLVNGIAFDSQKEARRYEILMDAVREGVIADLRLQQDFTLQEAFTTPEGKRIPAIRYKADFTYTVAWQGEYVPTGVSCEDLIYWRQYPGARVIEDVKSKATRTRVYINKYKMMADKGYTIREV